jgi:hypothetical protein
MEVWASKTGTVWHGDPGCRDLRSQARREVHDQPLTGQLDSLVGPDQTHCYPPGRLRAYMEAAETLINFDAITHDATTSLRQGDLNLAIFDPPRICRFPSEETRSGVMADELGRDEMAGLWNACRRRRSQAIDEARRELEHRLPVMLAAAWVATGKTPRQHQDRYARFLDVAEQECEARGITATTGIRSFANQNVLPYWLDRVAAGGSPHNVTASRAASQVESARSWSRKEPEEFFTALSGAWTAAGTAWGYLLDGIALSHEGQVLALFHKYGPQMGWDLGQAFLRLVPHAEICTPDFEWVVAKAPAVLALFLKERDPGLIGLVLESERTYAFDADKCALFLRNLLVDLECADLAQHVREITSEPGAAVDAQDDDAGSQPVHFRWQPPRFGNGLQGRGLTREHCLPALRTAWDDRSPQSPRVPISMRK